MHFSTSRRCRSYGAMALLVSCAALGADLSAGARSAKAEALRAKAAQGAMQEPQPGRAVFTTRSDLVVLNVSVVDRKKGFVSGLTRDAFSVYEDGRPQAIAFFDSEDSPAAVGLVIDSSTSMHRKREALTAGVLAFARSSHPKDEMFAVHFNERVWFGLPAGQAFTGDLDVFRAALQQGTARGRTALFDAVSAALKHVEQSTAPKKALVVISDGGDNASTTPRSEVLAAVDRSNVLVYTVCLMDAADAYDGEADPDTLEDLAEASGAETFVLRKIDDVTRVLERIAKDIRSGYLIGYVPPVTGASGYRSIRVEVNAPNRRRLIVRSRSGYLNTPRREAHGSR